MTREEFIRFAIQRLMEIRDAYREFMPEAFEANGNTFLHASIDEDYINIFNPPELTLEKGIEASVWKDAPNEIRCHVRTEEGFNIECLPLDENNT